MAGQLILALKEIVLDYSPSADLSKRIIQPAAACNTVSGDVPGSGANEGALRTVGR
jgi:hypothetical protein